MFLPYLSLSFRKCAALVLLTVLSCASPSFASMSGDLPAGAEGVLADAMDAPAERTGTPLPAAEASPAADSGVPAGQSSMQTRGEAPWRLNADKLVSIDDGVIVEASGGVLLQRGEDYMKADFARYYTTTNWIFVSGNVEARMGRDQLKAAEGEFDLNARTGWLKDGSIFIAGPHMYVKGEKVDKLLGDRYLFKNAKVTACDGDTPAWSVSAGEAEVELDGYATLKHTTLNILDVPVMDAPWLMLPAKTSRQSGLLLPDFGYSSVNGGFYTQPYFHVIDDSRDLTFTATYMGNVGFMPSLEYRAHTRDKDKTMLALDFLYDTHTFTSEADDPVNETDRKINTQKERFWLRGMGDGYVGDSEWRYRYNLDYVSDQNFLRQFRDMYTGFNRSRDAMYDMFGRDITEVDKNRVTEGYVYREWDRFMVSLGLRYEQTPYYGHGNISRDQDTNVQRIPLNAYLFKGRMFEDLPLELQGEVSTAYEYREKGVRGLRTEIHPELTMPVDMPGFSMLLNGGFRSTFYNSSTEYVSSERWARGTGNHDRFIPDVSASAFTQFSREWHMPEKTLTPSEENLGESSLIGVRHRLQPRVTYGWIPERDQFDNPIFEEMDRIKPSQQMRFSLTNLITTKKSVLKKEGDAIVNSDSFSDPLRWEVATGYDFDEASRHAYRDEFGRRPFMDLYSYLTYSPNEWLSLKSRIYLSMYGEGITRSDTGFTLKWPDVASWSLTYSTRDWAYNYLSEMKRDKRSDMRFTSDQRLLTNIFRLRPVHWLSLYYKTQDNLITGKNYEREFIMGYLHQCFRIYGSIRSKGKENSYRVILEMPGLSF